MKVAKQHFRWCAAVLCLLAFSGKTAAALSTEFKLSLALTHDMISAENVAGGGNDAQALKLNLARRLRQERDFDQAAKSLIGILNSGEASQELERTTLMELALMAQERNEPTKAQQIFAQYLQRYPQDHSAPEVLLRQGLLYREMGAYSLALAKLYAVMTTALNLKLDDDGHIQKLVLQAQMEIAETYCHLKRFSDAAECLSRLLKLNLTEPEEAEVRLKIIRCYSALRRDENVVSQAYEFLPAYPQSDRAPEVRFLLVSSLYRLERKASALREAQMLINAESDNGSRDTYWKQRLGNEFGNQLYRAGDYANALEIYQLLLHAPKTAAWQVPLLYQVGLCRERLHQPDEAAAAYAQVMKRADEIAAQSDPTLQTVLDMAQWRQKYLAWQIQAQQNNQAFLPPRASAPAAIP